MDELEISGKKYISSKRASELTGYAKDYIGQLARGGKVDATRVGRAWYVSLDSLQRHDGTEQAAAPSLSAPQASIERDKVAGSVTPAPQASSVRFEKQKNISLAHLRMGTFDVPKTWDSIKYYSDESPLLPVLFENRAPESSEMTSKINIIQRSSETRNAKLAAPSNSGKAIDGLISQPSKGFGVIYPSIGVDDSTIGRINGLQNTSKMPLEQKKGRKLTVDYGKFAAATMIPITITAFLFVVGLTIGGKWSITATESSFALAYGGSESSGMILGGISTGIQEGLAALNSFIAILLSSFSAFLGAGINFLLNLINLG